MYYILHMPIATFTFSVYYPYHSLLFPYYDWFSFSSSFLFL